MKGNSIMYNVIDIIVKLNPDPETRSIIIIKTKTEKDMLIVANAIHEQLIGNKDYKENKIILNMSSDRSDGTENEVHLYVHNDSETNQEIKMMGSYMYTEPQISNSKIKFNK